MNVICCPMCRSFAARRRHPLADAWKRFRRLYFVLTILGIRIASAAVFSFLTAFAAIGCLALWSEIHLPDGGMPRGGVLFLVAVFGILAPLLGAFLTTAFEHIALWRVWLGWFTWISMILLVFSLHGPIDPQLDPRHDPPLPGDTLVRWIGEGALFIAIPSTVAVLAILLAALAGVPLGRGLLWLGASGRRARWRRRYRRRRLARAAIV